MGETRLMMRDVATLTERLDLSAPKNLLGAHFPEIVSLLLIVFGGAFLLFGWRHHAYFLGVTGFLVGGWAGLLLKNQFAPPGGVPVSLYLAVCAMGGSFIAWSWPRLVGILLGGFTILVAGLAFSPRTFQPGDHALATACMAFLMGGGLGALFPKFFFILNSSLIGSAFVTYGVSTAVLGRVAGPLRPEHQALLHFCVFLPLLLFGVIYQSMTGADAAGAAIPMPRPARAA